ncbi:MAG TPA: DUF1232 domain-containing protein [Fervidobacterium nodosum]|nr:DUF1232 domain-containing protein [Fervidobacterium nodosum]
MDAKQFTEHESYRKAVEERDPSVMQKAIDYINSKNLFAKFKDFIEFVKKILSKQITVPGWAILAIIGTCGYILSPLDVVPDFIPLIGMLDDVTLALATLESIKKHIKGGGK